MLQPTFYSETIHHINHVHHIHHVRPFYIMTIMTLHHDDIFKVLRWILARRSIFEGMGLPISTIHGMSILLLPFPVEGIFRIMGNDCRTVHRIRGCLLQSENPS